LLLLEESCGWQNKRSGAEKFMTVTKIAQYDLQKKAIYRGLICWIKKPIIHRVPRALGKNK